MRHQGAKLHVCFVDAECANAEDGFFTSCGAGTVEEREETFLEGGETFFPAYGCDFFAETEEEVVQDLDCIGGNGVGGTLSPELASITYPPGMVPEFEVLGEGER